MREPRKINKAKPTPKKKKALPTRYQRNSSLTTLSAPPKIGRPIEWTPERIEIERLALEKWIKNPKNYYFMAFFNERRIAHETVERLAREDSAFCVTLKLARAMQEQRLVELAITKKGDGNFIKFVLQNKAGWKEKQELSGDGANPLAVIMARIADSAKDPLDYDG